MCIRDRALAVLMPFKAQEVRDRGGVYYGQNVISKNLIIANRKELLNGNGFVLGVSGSGKSFMAKQEMVGVTLADNGRNGERLPDDIIVIDPEAEYRPLIEGLGGEVISISADVYKRQNPILSSYLLNIRKQSHLSPLVTIPFSAMRCSRKGFLLSR